MFGLGLNTDDVNQDCFKWCWTEAARKNNSRGDMCQSVVGCPQCSLRCPQTPTAAYRDCSARCAANDPPCIQNCLDSSKALQAKWKPPTVADHFYRVTGKSPYWVPDPLATAATPVRSGSQQPAQGSQSVAPEKTKTLAYVAIAAIAAAVLIGSAFIYKKKAVPNRRKGRRRR